jgi:hypothetical protein
MKVARPQKSTLNPRITPPDIRARWGRFDEVELAAIKSRSDLVMQIQAKYGLNKLQAETNVDVWAKRPRVLRPSSREEGRLRC